MGNYGAAAAVSGSMTVAAALVAMAVPLLIMLIAGFFFGNATKKMNAAKGYEGGFWWGFFLGVMGLIVIAVRPFNLNNPKYAPKN